MPDLSITLDLQTLGTIAGGVVAIAGAVLRAGSGLTSRLVNQIEKYRESTAFQIETVRTESNEGRKRVHQRLDDLRTHMDETFLRRDTYEADRRTVQQAIEETQRMVDVALQRRSPSAPALPAILSEDPAS